MHGLSLVRVLQYQSQAQTEPNDFALSESIADDLYIQGCLGQLEARLSILV